MIRGTILKTIKSVPFFETAETPIADEIAIGADIKSITATPSFGDIRDIDELLDALRQMPVIVRGSAFGRIAGQWYTVTFPRRVDNPHVVCTAMARAGAFVSAEIARVPKPTKREIARATRPTLIDIPKEPRTEITPITLDWPSREEMVSEACATLDSGCNDMMKEHIGEWLVFPVLSTGTFCRALSRSSFGEWLSDFWDKHVKSKFTDLKDGVNETVDLVYNKLYGQIDKTTTAMQENINRLYATETIDQINKVRDSIDLAIGDLHTATNAQVNYIRDRVNNVIKDLYRMWGVPGGYILTPVHIRNITNVGFEFQSYGTTTIHFIAIGTEE